jgi:hypothetical protein
MARILNVLQEYQKLANDDLLGNIASINQGRCFQNFQGQEPVLFFFPDVNFIF